jgi:hypothetical protein
MKSRIRAGKYGARGTPSDKAGADAVDMTRD